MSVRVKEHSHRPGHQPVLSELFSCASCMGSDRLEQCVEVLHWHGGGTCDSHALSLRLNIIKRDAGLALEF